MSHDSDPKVRKGLKQAQGHLESILTMLAGGRSCPDVVQQLQAVESTIRGVKRTLIHDHIEHSMADAVTDGGMSVDESLREFKALLKYL
jgi:hypothetical protein NreA